MNLLSGNFRRCACVRPYLLFLALTLAPSIALAQVRGAIAGDFPTLFAGGSDFAVEDVELDPALVPALRAVPLDGTLQVRDWPVTPGARADVQLARFDVYASDARIVAIDADGQREVPRSNWLFFAGWSASDPSLRLLVSLDPDSGGISGFSESAAGRAEWRPLESPPGTRMRVADPRLFLTPAEQAAGREVTCGEEELPPSIESLFGAPAAPPPVSEAITTLHRATISVDTDNEFFTKKFSTDVANYTTRASNYIASLMAGMTVVYERDLLVRLQLGTTFLRLPAGGDPWNQGGSPANSAQLNELSTYWAGNCGGGGCGSARALAMLLSGKSTGGGSGIAWVNSLCSASNGYSFSQIFVPGSATAATQEVYLVGHELGHNFGSPHTHCYNPPIDSCYAAQAGCYSGPTSCPAPTTINGVTSVRGTIMSYCHGLSGCSGSSVFHPTSVLLLQPLIQSKVNQCIFPTASALQATSITPPSGSTAGGTPITIRGTSFVAGGALAVSLGGVAATSVTRVNDSTITAVTGPHATGAVNLSLTNGDGATAALAPAYFYAPPVVADNFYTLTPCRLFDTRSPNGPLGGPALAAGAARTFTVSGVCGVLASASAISANVTVVAPAQTGALSVYPGNAMFLGTTAINFKPGNVRANNAMIELATNGAGTITILNQSSGSVHVLLDVNGQFR